MLHKVVAILIFVALAAGCSRGIEGAITGAGKVEAPRVKVPSQILGLLVAPEDVSAQTNDVERPYLDAVAVFSLREEDLLRATLQVGRFNRIARPNQAAFRKQVVSTVGGTVAEEMTVEGLSVYATSGTDQQLYSWIDGDGFYVLSIHKDFEFPRTLLRRVIRLHLEL